MNEGNTIKFGNWPFALCTFISAIVPRDVKAALYVVTAVEKA